MAKLRAMPVYVEDLLSDADVDQMDAETFGAYMRLLFYSWKEDGIPTDLDRLARMARVSTKGGHWLRVWARLSPKWHVSTRTSGGSGESDVEVLRNSKQERIREAVKSHSEAQANRAKQRWDGNAGASPPGNAAVTVTVTDRINDPTDRAPQGAPTPKQTDFDLEKGALPTAEGDLPAGKAIYSVFEHWTKLYPEHKDAQLQGKRPSVIKAAIANRRAAHGGANKYTRRQAVEEIKKAIDAAKGDPWCAGQNLERTPVTELSALLAIEVLERLCRLAAGEEPRAPAPRAAGGGAAPPSPGM